MVLPVFSRKAETPETLLKKAEELLARAQKHPIIPPGAQASGDHRLKRKGHEGDFRQFRAYQPGDRPQDIDWKRSARSDDIHMREREQHQRAALTLYVPASKGMDFQSGSNLTKYETACVIALAFALQAKHHHDPVSYAGETVQPAQLSPMLFDRIAPVLPSSSSATLVLLGDFLDEEATLERFFASIPSRKVVLLQVLDAAELDLPWQGRAVFENLSLKTTVNNVPDIREAYRRKILAHQEFLSALARRRQWHFAALRSDEDMAPAFNRALAYKGDAA